MILAHHEVLCPGKLFEDENGLYAFKHDGVCITDPHYDETGRELVDPSYYGLSSVAVAMIQMKNDLGKQDLWLSPPKNFMELVDQLNLVREFYPKFTKVEIKQEDDEVSHAGRTWWNVQVRISHDHDQIVLESRA